MLPPPQPTLQPYHRPTPTRVHIVLHVAWVGIRIGLRNQDPHVLVMQLALSETKYIQGSLPGPGAQGGGSKGHTGSEWQVKSG